MNTSVKRLLSLSVATFAITCLQLSPAGSQSRGVETRSSTPMAPVPMKPVVGPASVNPASHNPQNTDLKKQTEAEIKKAAEDKKNADAAAARKKLSAMTVNKKVTVSQKACLQQCGNKTDYHPPAGSNANQSGGGINLFGDAMQASYDSSHQQEKAAYKLCTAKC